MDEEIPAWPEMSGPRLRNRPEKIISGTRTIGILCLALTAGCAGSTETAPGATAPPLIIAPSRVEPNRDSAVTVEPPVSETIREGVAAVPPPPPVMTDDEASGIEPVADAPTTTTAPSRSQSATMPAPSAKAPAKGPASPVAVAQPRKSEGPAAVAKTPEPPLDVAALKARLRDTDAIGLFTKLALKNQVDDLLQQFRAHYLGGPKSSVAVLRQPYDMLVLKVLALLQDKDPSLARTIAGSREAIWGILADRDKFHSVG